jgi:chloride channel protein, CIC family
VAHPDEPLRIVVNRMAETGITRLPVVESDGDARLVGMVSLRDLLQARLRSLEEERRRERALRVHLPFGRRLRPDLEAGAVSTFPGPDSR